MKAVIFTDATLSHYPEGRTGKSLMAQGIIELRNGVMLDGKVFNTSNRFRYQMVSELTDVVIINDVGDKGQFKFEQMFTAITEGIFAEKKHQRPVFIQPKFLVTSNRAIDVFGASAKDRCVEFEFSNHYGSENSPLDEFGHKFFQDWTSTEWEGFDNYVAYCIQQYHIHGLLNPKSIHLEERRIIDHTTGNSSFLEWAEKRPVNTRMEKNSMFQDYCASVPLEDALSIRQFSNYLKLYAETRNFKYEEEKSNSKVFFKFSK